MNAPWVIAMGWRDALFLHWPVAPEQLRPLIPRDLDIDVYEGSAWIGIVAFRITAVRPRGVPAGLVRTSFGEINVRTYVNAGKPGVWFFSLDAASALAVTVGRRAIHLPYHRAAIATAWTADTCAYDAERADGAPRARFTVSATISGDERVARAGTLEHSLVERYCFYTSDRSGRTVRGDVVHEPWPLRDAAPAVAENTLLSAAAIVPSGAAPPLAHASSGVSTHAWPLRVR